MDRKARERADRERRIVAAARELAEAEGWEAVTTRRLAARIEYSQPVLYSHFAGKDDIVRAVAAEGVAELAAELRAAREADGARGVALAWSRFALRRPALYDAMFTLPGTAAGPPERVVHELRQVTAGGDHDPETAAEVLLAALHGLVALSRTGRLRPGRTAERLEVLLSGPSRGLP